MRTTEAPGSVMSSHRTPEGRAVIRCSRPVPLAASATTAEVRLIGPAPVIDSADVAERLEHRVHVAVVIVERPGWEPGLYGERDAALVKHEDTQMKADRDILDLAGREHADRYCGRRAGRSRMRARRPVHPMGAESEQAIWLGAGAGRQREREVGYHVSFGLRADSADAREDAGKRTHSVQARLRRRGLVTSAAKPPGKPPAPASAQMPASVPDLVGPVGRVTR